MTDLPDLTGVQVLLVATALAPSPSTAPVATDAPVTRQTRLVRPAYGFWSLLSATVNLPSATSRAYGLMIELTGRGRGDQTEQGDQNERRHQRQMNTGY